MNDSIAPARASISAMSLLQSSDIVVYNFRETLSHDWQLVVYLAAPKAIQVHHFRVENASVKASNL